MKIPPSKADGRQRAQSAPLGVALVFAVMIISTTAVLAIGAGAITDTETRLGAERTQKSLTEFDSRAALVALGQSNVQQVELASRGSENYRVDGTAGWMNVSYEDPETGNTTVIFRERMGAVINEDNSQTEIAYQGGGVWRSDGAGQSVMVSPPEFHYREATLTLPLITVSGDRSLGTRGTISKSGSTRHFPNRTKDPTFVNPMDNGQVTVTVQSEYYRGWGEYFETRTDGDVNYDHSKNTVNATLVTPVGDRRVRSAVKSSSPAGVIKFKGSTDPGFDAYDSSDGDGYAGEGAANGWNNGSVNTAGDVDIQDNGVKVYGNITSGGYVDLKDWSKNFEGERVEYADGYSPNPAPAGVETEQISGVEGVSSIDGYVNRRVEDIEDDPDSGYYSGGTISSTGTLDSAGGDKQYYAKHIDLDSGETLTIDTSGGNVSVAVRDYISLDEAAIEVDGTHEARFYIKGENAWGIRTIKGDSTLSHVDIAGGSVETVGSGPSENATQVAFYGKSHVNTTLSKDGGNSKVVGIIYMPSQGTNRLVMRQSEVYGGVVTGEVDVWQDGAIHYDVSLRNTRAVPEEANIIRITYLHISVNRINVTSS
ncbi:hypothetical protein [Haloarcula sp. 1CSR25-25]|uniref:DUF7289 family protein n=1 Tax=Haloarcula sp. 1CSR25-25 TaxID=2862545 RepID=UPI002895B0E8|nr:hypothetical protein [Haloarcula sp. 1CSR25-25]MDT3436605.1 hypothetical protein [Haloarcula sp. 1CSR25-25]